MRYLDEQLISYRVEVIRVDINEYFFHLHICTYMFHFTLVLNVSYPSTSLPFLHFYFMIQPF